MPKHVPGRQVLEHVLMHMPVHVPCYVIKHVPARHVLKLKHAVLITYPQCTTDWRALF